MSDTESEVDHEDERTTIRTGRDFEQTYRLDASEAGRFLVDLGEQLQRGDELVIAEEEWELPFAFGEPELEIELELPGRTDEDAPSVE
ncbi:amphi-Trp domain-containing protein [Halobacteriales archaeon QH_8_67_27]|nr:MAG: amphi-Trp domain-containing protein [Halobacteriales archaeon QH_8_67_27]